jgi:hypothetical protein
MADVVSHREMQQNSFDNQSALTPDAPKPLERGELGPNPFEESWTHNQVMRPQTDGDESPEAGDTQAAADDANVEDVVETQPDERDEQDQDDEATQPHKQTPNPELALLKQQNAELTARLNRLEAAKEPEAKPEVDQGIPWDAMELPPLPEELDEYREPIAKQIIAVAEYAINHMQARAQQEQIRQQRVQTEQSLRTQIEDMVADPAYADYETYYPRMKEIAQSAPALLQQPNGLKAIYVAAKGDGPAAPARNGNGATGDDSYARGVKKGLASAQGKRASAVDTPRSVPANTRPVQTGPRSLDEALNQEFARAREAQLRQP